MIEILITFTYVMFLLLVIFYIESTTPISIHEVNDIKPSWIEGKDYSFEYPVKFQTTVEELNNKLFRNETITASDQEFIKNAKKKTKKQRRRSTSVRSGK